MPTFWSVVRSLVEGFALRCPNCHRGRLTTSPLALFTVHDACPRCGVSFEPGRGEFTGAMMLAWGFIGWLALFGYFVLHVFMDVPLWVEYAWLVGVAVGVPVVFYRNLKGVWVGILHAAGRLGPPRPGA